MVAGPEVIGVYHRARALLSRMLEVRAERFGVDPETDNLLDLIGVCERNHNGRTPLEGWLRDVRDAIQAGIDRIDAAEAAHNAQKILREARGNE